MFFLGKDQKLQKFCLAQLMKYNLPNQQRMLVLASPSQTHHKNESCKMGNRISCFVRELYECFSVNASFLCVGEG